MAGKIIILPRDRLAWHKQMVEDRGLSDMAFRVGVIIGIHFNNRTGRTFVGYDGIAERIGIERTSVWRSITALRDRGHLEVLSGGGRNVANEYRMILKTVAPMQRFDAAETVASRVKNGCRIATTTLPAPTEQDSTQHFVGEDTDDAAQWAGYLRQRKQIMPFAITLPDGRRGFWMPSPRPPIETERSSLAEPKRSGDEETFDRFRDRLARIKLEKKSMGDLLHELWSAPRNHHPTMLDTCVRHGRGGSKVFKEPLGAATAGAVARDFFSMHTHFDLFDDPIPEGWGRKGDPSTIPS